MSKPLISVGSLITQSWHQFVRNWNQTLHISFWFMLAPIILFLFALLGHGASSDPISALLFQLVVLLNSVLMIWTIIRLLICILASDAGKSPDPDESRKAWSLFFPLIWISILTGLAVLGGMILLILPGIWLGVSFMFARLFLIEDNVRGVQSLSASRALVKGRWWPVFWRTVIPGILFFLVFFILMNILFAIFGAIAGAAKMNLMLSMYGSNSPAPVAMASFYLVNGLAQMLLVPLVVTWMAKLFHSLKETRNS